MGKLSIKEKENALNEVRILASISHPNIVGYKEAFFEDATQCLCIIMDFVDDGDLYEKIVKHQKSNRMVDELTCWSILIETVRALHTLHTKEILHRDLKSANVFLSKDGSAKLGDMNVSKVAKKGLLYTQTGTPYCASPEVWRDQPYNSKSDIWSLGCVIYELVTLKPPFRANDMNGLYKRVLKGQYPPISHKYSKELTQVIAKLLTVDPKARPSTKEILKMSSVAAKSKELQNQKEYFCALDEYAKEAEDPLLKTIRVPGNLANLTSRLPKSNYDKLRGPHTIRSNSGMDFEDDRGDTGAKQHPEPQRRNLTQIQSMKDIAAPARNNSKINVPKEQINVRASQQIQSSRKLQENHEYDGRSNATGQNQYDNRQQIYQSASQPISTMNGNKQNGPNRLNAQRLQNIRNSSGLPDKSGSGSVQNGLGLRSNASTQGRSNLQSKIMQEVALAKQNKKSFEKDFLDDLKLPSVNEKGQLNLNSQPVTTINDRNRILKVEGQRQKEQQSRQQYTYARDRTKPTETPTQAKPPMYNRNNNAYGSIGRDGVSQQSGLTPAFRNEEINMNHRSSIQDAGSSVIDSIKLKNGRNAKLGPNEGASSLQPDRRQTSMINELKKETRGQTLGGARLAGGQQNPNTNSQIINAYSNGANRETPAAMGNRSNSQMRQQPQSQYRPSVMDQISGKGQNGSYNNQNSYSKAGNSASGQQAAYQARIAQPVIATHNTNNNSRGSSKPAWWG